MYHEFRNSKEAEHPIQEIHAILRSGNTGCTTQYVTVKYDWVVSSGAIVDRQRLTVEKFD